MASFIRMLHASPNGPAIDIYANDKIVVRRLAYKKFTSYISVVPGTYHLKVLPANAKTDPLLAKKVTVPDKSIFTGAVIGLCPSISLLPVPDLPPRMNPDKAYLRFGHLAPQAARVDLILPDGNVLFGNVPYKGLSKYSELPPGTYTLQLRVSGTNRLVCTVPRQRLAPHKIFSVYAIGLAGEDGSFQLLTSLDGAPFGRVVSR